MKPILFIAFLFAFSSAKKSAVPANGGDNAADIPLLKDPVQGKQKTVKIFTVVVRVHLTTSYSDPIQILSNLSYRNIPQKLRLCKFQIVKRLDFLLIFQFRS